MKSKLLKFFNREKKIRLPVYIKMFANNNEPKEEISKESLKRMAEALLDKKDVIFLVDGEPYRVSLKNKKVKGEFIKNYKWVLE